MVNIYMYMLMSKSERFSDCLIGAKDKAIL